MNSYKMQGETLDLAAPYAVAAGAGALITTVFGVAVNTLANGEVGPFKLCGVFELPKATGAVTALAKVYWDNTNKNVTTTASGNSLIGVAVAAALSGDPTVIVRLNGISI
jgi:predicted RecA/RadA family phage recombinase